MVGMVRMTWAWTGIALVAVGAFALTVVLLPETEATHYLSGSMDWRVTGLLDPVGAIVPLDPTNEVELQVKLQFRDGVFCAPCFVGQNVGTMGLVNWGDGLSTSQYDARIMNYDQALGLLYVQFFETGTFQPLRHAYSAPGVYAADWGQCCRMGSAAGHINNPDTPYRLQATIDTSGKNDSPVFNAHILHDCQASGLCTMHLPASDANGDAIAYRFATSTEAAGSNQVFHQPGQCCGTSTAWLDSTNGTLHWETTGTQLGSGTTIYSAQVMAGDGKGWVPFEFRVRLLAPPPAVHTHDIAFDLQGSNLHIDVWAFDQGDAAASNVTVDVEVCASTCIQRTGETDAEGRVHFKWPGPANPGAYTLCVTGMSHATLPWNQAAGHAANENCASFVV